MVTLSLGEISSLSRGVLRGSGLDDANSNAIAEVVVAAQRDECHSHGLYRLLGCVHSVQNGKVNLVAVPIVRDVAPGIVKVDARFGFSPLAFEMGLPVALAKAREQGLCALVINHCFHFSALWCEVEAIGNVGLAAIAMTPSHAWVAPVGGTKPVLGTNPIAFAWPRRDANPYVFDFATSATARGEIELCRRAGSPIPQGLALDLEGEPTTDPTRALQGAMLTFGGHKGSALSTMVELMAGPLIDDMLSLESQKFDDGVGAAPCHGELLLIFNPKIFLGDALAANLDRAEILFDAILGQGARLPSQRRYEARARSLTSGVSIKRALYDDLSCLARG